MSTAHGGAHSPGDPLGSDPGLDHLIRALTASGYPHERAGRDAALAAFRAVSEQRRQPAGGFRGRWGFLDGFSRAGRSRGQWRILLRTRVAAVSLAGVAVLAGLTAAAYAQALPGPVQRIAHSMLAPLGVPGDQRPGSPGGSGGPGGPGGPGAPSQPASAPVARHASATARSAASSSPGATAASAPTPSLPASSAPSSSPSSPTPAASAPATAAYTVTLAVADSQGSASGFDFFTGTVTNGGVSAAHVQVQLLEQVAGASSWQVAATGVTTGHGTVRLKVSSPATTATFVLAGPGGTRSAPVTIQAGSSVQVQVQVQLQIVSGPAMYHMIVTVTSASGHPDGTVLLNEQVGGVWETVKSRQLGGSSGVNFPVRASSAQGYLFQAELLQPGTSAPVYSSQVLAPSASTNG